MQEAHSIDVQPTREEAEQLLTKMLVELRLMNGTRVFLEHRLKRQEDFMDRVGFSDAKPARRERVLKRAETARRELSSLLAEIHSFEQRITDLRRDLMVR